MLKLNESLNAKTISGKKYRSPFFIPCLIIFIIVFFATLIISSNTIPDTYQGGDRAILIGLYCVVCAGIPFALMIGTRHVVCVLSDDGLYFFGCEVVRKKSSSQKSESRGYANGAILYSDIKNIDFFRMKYEYYNHRRQYITPPSIVIHGEGFSVRMSANRSLIKKINEKCNKHIFAISEDQIEFPADGNQQGLWRDVLKAFENGKFETIWSPDISIEYCSLDIYGEMIDITLSKNDMTICFNLDKDSIYVCYPPSDEDDTVQLSAFRDINDLISYMNECTKTITPGKKHGFNCSEDGQAACSMLGSTTQEDRKGTKPVFGVKKPQSVSLRILKTIVILIGIPVVLFVFIYLVFFIKAVISSF